MERNWILNLFLCHALLQLALTQSHKPLQMYHEYGIVGGGIAGVQMGYFFANDVVNHDFVIFESHEHKLGSFFHHYPRHDTLLSINKKNTGSLHKEFNLRHDWNSLLCWNSTVDCLSFTNYSDDYFPNKTRLVKYLNDFALQHNVTPHVLFNSRVTKISKVDDRNYGEGVFKLRVNVNYNNGKDKDNGINDDDEDVVYYYIKYLLIATGLSKPRIPESIHGIEHTIGYESMPLDLSYYKNKRVAVLGSKNSAFETANYISQVTALTHIIANKIPHLSYESHYVGDLRAINARFFDQYFLKSLDAFADVDSMHDWSIVKLMDDSRSANVSNDTCTDNDDGDNGDDNQKYKLGIEPRGDILCDIDWSTLPNPLRARYDIIIRCLGFDFDRSIFDSFINLQLKSQNDNKFPSMNDEFENSKIKNLYFIGALMHKIDYKRSSGGFIHGFRYLVKSLYRQLMYKHKKINHYLNQQSEINGNEILIKLFERINTASSMYQMFGGYMYDGILICNNTNSTSKLNDKFYYFKDLLKSDLTFIVQYISSDINNKFKFDLKCNQLITFHFDYNPTFHGPEKVLYTEPRTHGDYETSELSNFLHPIMQHYVLSKVRNKKALISERHLLEDFFTMWDHQIIHVNYLKEWVENIVKIDQLSFDFHSHFPDFAA